MLKNNSITFFKLICAILVVAIHTNPFLDFNYSINFFIVNILAKIAVPFFFIISGFFYSNKIGTFKYPLKILNLYFWWSFIYSPLVFIIPKLLKNKEPFLSAFKETLKFSLLDGFVYHLWFLQALFISVVLFNLLKKIKINENLITIISVLFYSFGLCGTGYYLLALNSSLHNFIVQYENLFYTTKNGFFFGFPLFYLGYKLSKINLDNFKNSNIKKFIFLFFILVVLETFILNNYNIPKILDMTVFIPILTSLIIIFLLKNPKEFDYFSCDYSTGIYVSHIIFIVIFSKVLQLIHIKNNLFLFLLVLLASFFTTFVGKKVKVINNIF